MKYLPNLKQFSKENRKKMMEKFFSTLQQEIKDKSELRTIFLKYISGKKIEKEEIDYVREQLLDILKILGLTTFLILPASVVIIPAIINLSNKYNMNLIPNLMRTESITEEELAELIIDGKKIYVEHIHDYSDHNKEEAYVPVSIDTEGNIALDIDDKIYYTKLDWVTRIEELNHFTFGEEQTTNIGKDSTWKGDVEFNRLLKDHGGLKGVISKMKKHYRMDYSNCKNEEELYRNLKGDNML